LVNVAAVYLMASEALFTKIPETRRYAGLGVSSELGKGVQGPPGAVPHGLEDAGVLGAQTASVALLL
jgi:hypothetical protein